MHVQVGDGLPAVGTVVDDQAISGIRHAFSPSDFRCGKQQVPEQGGVIRFRFAHAGQWLARDDQNVQRRLRGNDWEKSPMRSSMPSIISEENAPGAMAFTLMWKRDHSTASASVMRTIADFVTE